MASKLSVLLVLLALVACVTAQTVISTCQELQDMNNNLGGSYALANDIDCSATATWNSGAGFEPVGDGFPGFSGSFDGQGYRISGLTINRPGQNFVGLFGYTMEAGTITSVGLLGGSITGNFDVGGLVGYHLGTLAESYSTATITGARQVGGAVGRSFGSLNRCYATGDVTSTGDSAGGLLGHGHGAVVSSSYASGTVIGADNTGGLVGANANYGTVSNSYATGSVVGANLVGGLLGINSGVLSNSYSTGTVTGSSNEGGLIGLNSGGTLVITSYWDTQTSGQASSGAGVGKTTAQMYQEASFEGWDFDCTWMIDEGSGYPQLTGVDCSGRTINVNTCTELQTAVFATDADIVLAQDVDCAATATWNSGAGFFPGAALSRAGSFDGNGYIISNLTINRPTTDGVALFVAVGPFAEVRAAVLLDGSVVGQNYVAPLVSWLDGTLTTSQSTVTVMGGERVGGLLSYHFGVVNDCYAMGSVTGTTYVGGLLGYHFQGSVTRSYATGSVSGSSAVGGLIGDNNNGMSSASYWDTQTSGQLISDGGLGRTTAQMQQKTTFSGWDFITVWWIHQDYPRLRVSSAPPVQVVNPIADKNYPVGLPFSFSFPANTMQDPMDANLDYSAQLLGGSPLSGWLAFTSSTRIFSGTSPASALGSIEIEVIGTNDDGYGESEVFTLTITNCAPTQDNVLVDQTVAVGDLLSYAFAANSFSDCDGHALSYTAQLNGGGSLPSWITFTAGARTFSGTPPAGAQGSLLLDVTAEDGFGGSVTGTFTVTVSNRAPTVQTPINTQYATSGELFEFTVPAATFVDGDGDDLTLSATQADESALPTWLDFSAADALFSGTPSVRATYQVKVKAVDGFGGEINTTFTLIVPNTPPALVGGINSQVASINSVFSFTFSTGLFNDPDGDVLQYSAQQSDGSALPAWLSFDASQRLFSGTPAAEDQGTLEIELTADDGFSGQATALFTLTVPSGGSSALTDGEIAAIALSITGSVAGLLYTGYKFYNKRKYYKANSAKGDKGGAAMDPL